MKKTLVIPFLFTSFIGCDGSDSLLSYETEAGATYLALSDGLPPQSNIPDKELDLDDAFVTNEEESLDVDALACEATFMRDRFLRLKDRLEEGDLSIPYKNNTMREGLANRRQAHRRHMRHKIMKRIIFIYDVDGDRIFNEAERNTILSDLDVRCQNITAQILEHFDANEDSMLNEEERVTAKDAWIAKKEDKRNAFREAADTNNDGEISEEERHTAFEARRTKHHEKRHALKTQFDIDGDGVLSAEEKEALREFLRQQLRMEHGQEEDTVR